MGGIAALPARRPSRTQPGYRQGFSAVLFPNWVPLVARGQALSGAIYSNMASLAPSVRVVRCRLHSELRPVRVGSLQLVHGGDFL